MDELPPKSIMSRDSLWCQTPIRGGDSIFDKLDPYCIVKPGAPNDPASGTAPASERFGKVPNSSGSKGGTRRSFSFLPRLGEFKRFQTPVMWNVGVNPQFEHLSWQVDPLFRDFFLLFYLTVLFGVYSWTLAVGTSFVQVSGCPDLCR